MSFRKPGGTLCFLVLLLAVSFRAALPAGFMPDAERGFVLCAPGGTQTLFVDPVSGEITTGDDVSPEGCEWSPLLSQAALPVLDAAAAPAGSGAVLYAHAATHAPQLPRAPPRARGPPHII